MSRRCCCTSRRPTSSRRPARGASSNRSNDGLMSTAMPTRRTVDGAAAASVDAERAAGGDAIRDRWHAASKDMQAAFAAADPHARVTWVTNLLSVQTLGGDAALRMLDPHRRHRVGARRRRSHRPIACGSSRGSPGARSPTRSNRPALSMHGPVALDLPRPERRRVALRSRDAGTHDDQRFGGRVLRRRGPARRSRCARRWSAPDPMPRPRCSWCARTRCSAADVVTSPRNGMCTRPRIQSIGARFARNFSAVATKPGMRVAVIGVVDRLHEPGLQRILERVLASTCTLPPNSPLESSDRISSSRDGAEVARRAVDRGQARCAAAFRRCRCPAGTDRRAHGTDPRTRVPRTCARPRRARRRSRHTTSATTTPAITSAPLLRGTTRA